MHHLLKKVECIPRGYVEDIDIDEDGPPEHLWSSIAPSTEESRMHSIQEGSEQLTEVSQEDLQTNENILTPDQLTYMLDLRVLYTNQQEIPTDQYRQYLRDLNNSKNP